jgi:hypothetical protein
MYNTRVTIKIGMNIGYKNIGIIMAKIIISDC